MITTIRTLSVGFVLCLVGNAAFGQARESLAPANPHSRSVSTSRTVPNNSGNTINRPNNNNTQPSRQNTTQSTNNGLTRSPAATNALFVRLGLTGTKTVATGRIFNVAQNGTVTSQMGTYTITSDGRFMMFPAGSDRRLDIHSALFNPTTNVVGCKFTGINLTAARNTGGGGINLSLNGTGAVQAEIQTWYDMVGNQVVPMGYPRVRIAFFPS